MKLLLKTVLLICGLLSTNTVFSYTFTLQGGHFFGPGPIIPDLALPDGKIKNIQFDENNFTGFAPFVNNGTKLTDGETLINENIEAGVLTLGQNKQRKQKFSLVAVNGGPQDGKETYYFNQNYEFIWKVDFALDPGFPEGIIRVNDFFLTTGIVEIPNSLQSEKNIPGGYDKAGSKLSGDYLFGQVGDFDNDGFLDGIIVAAPHVPLKSNLLPGSPVGNQRGFTSDIPIKPLVACELTLRNIRNFKTLVDKSIEQNNAKQLEELLNEIRGRIYIARNNFDRALLIGSLKHSKVQVHTVGWHIDAVETLVFIPWALLSSYDYRYGNLPESIVESTGLFFEKLDKLITDIAALNHQFDQTFTPTAPKF
jgi:hypothetical protein